MSLAIICSALLGAAILWATVAAAETKGKFTKNPDQYYADSDDSADNAATPADAVNATDSIPADVEPDDVTTIANLPDPDALPSSAAPITDIDEEVLELTPEQLKTTLARKIARLEQERYHLQNPVPGETFEDVDKRLKQLDKVIRKLNKVAKEKQIIQ
jgi:cytoskeletal protein RodZ